MKRIVRIARLGLLAGLLVLPACTTQQLAQGTAAHADCNRACLTAVMTDYLAALQAGSAARLRVVAPVHFTEDQTQRVFGKEGIWSSHVELMGYRFDIIDVRAGTAAALVKVKIDGAPALVALRLLTRGGRITGAESIAVHSRDEGMIFKTDAIQKLSAAMAYTPTPQQRNSREEMIAAASHYPRGLQAGSFEKVDAPFAEDAYRFENGQLMAFKVYGGQIHAVEAFMKVKPAAQPLGWDD